MKIHKLRIPMYAAAVQLAVLAAGCSKDAGTEEVSRQVSITVRSGGENPSGSTLLTAGSSAGFYMVNAGAGLASERIFDNVRLTYGGGSFAAGRTLYYPENGTGTYDAYAYVPYRETGDGSGSISLRVKSDQKEERDYLSSDFLLARAAGHRVEDGAIGLNFYHPLSMIKVILKPGGSYASPADIPSPRSAAVLGLSCAGNIDIATGAFSGVSEPSDITPFGSFSEQGGVLEGVSAIVIPQTVKAGTELLNIDAGKDNFRYAPETDLILEAGKIHTLTLTLNASFGNVVITMECSVEDWADGGGSDLDADEILPPEGPTVKDADGNEYPIVRIGRQYWMAENLRTTRYNDGTPIPEITGDKEWLEASGGARCSYGNVPDNYAVYGALYNRKAVNTRRLCPPGWHVPSGAEWDALAATLGGTVDDYQSWYGVGATLKAAEGWADGENGTDSSGFAALPGGYRYADTQYDKYASFQNGGVYSCWWSMTELSSYMSYARSVQGDVLYRYARSNESGCSVRCINDF